MESGVIGNDPRVYWDLLLQRFPEIGFLLSLEEERDSFSDDRESFELPSLDGVDVLYVYGTGLGDCYDSLKPWLDAKRGRSVVFFEENLAVLRKLFSLPAGLRILQDPRAHVLLLTKPFSWDAVLNDCIGHWISDRVEFVALSFYAKGQEKKIKTIRMELLRKSALMSVAVTESLHYHRLMENLAANFCVLPDSFHVNGKEGICRNVPAVICGAGVSLAEAKELLKELENKALIVAGGSAVTALHNFGIRPHIAMALDPNEEEYGRIKGSHCFEIPFIYSSRLQQEVLTSTNVQAGYLCSDTGGAFEAWMQEELGIDTDSLGPELGPEALSVTTLAVPLMKHLGCNPIIFCGVDLSYQDMQRYPPGVISSAKVFLDEMKAETRSMEKLLRKKNGEGHLVHTLVKWVMEASCLSLYAKSHKEIKFFNASSRGLPIGGVPYLSLQEFIDLYCRDGKDLRGLLYAEAETGRFSDISLQEVKGAFRKLLTSLSCCLPILEEMLQEIERKLSEPFIPGMSCESGKMQVLEMDLVEQICYPICLESVFSLYSKILDRCYPSDAYLDPETARRNDLEKKKQLWTECYKVVKACSAVAGKHMGRDENS